MIRKVCRVKYGYSGIADVNSDNVEHDDELPSSFIAKGLKMLYLTFSPENYMQVNEYFLNAAGHFIKID